MVWIYAVLALLLALPLYVALREPVWNVPVIGIFVGLLVALCYLIGLRLKRNIQKDPAAEGSRESFMPKREQSRKFVLGMGFVAVAIGVWDTLSLVSPLPPIFAREGGGRLFGVLYDLMGPLGSIAFSLGCGIAFLLSAWRRK